MALWVKRFLKTHADGIGSIFYDKKLPTRLIGKPTLNISKVTRTLVTNRNKPLNKIGPGELAGLIKFKININIFYPYVILDMQTMKILSETNTGHICRRREMKEE